MRIDKKKDFKKKFNLCATLLEVEEPLKIILDESFISCCINFKIPIKDDLSKLTARKLIIMTTNCMVTRTQGINQETSYAIKKMTRYKCPHNKEKKLNKSVNVFLKQIYNNNYANRNSFFANGAIVTHNFDNLYNFKDPFLNQGKTNLQNNTSKETNEKEKRKRKKRKRKKKEKEENCTNKEEDRNIVDTLKCEQMQKSDIEIFEIEQEGKTKKEKKRKKDNDKEKNQIEVTKKEEEVKEKREQTKDDETIEKQNVEETDVTTSTAKTENVSHTEETEKIDGNEKKKEKKKKNKEDDNAENNIQLSSSAKCIIDLVKNNNNNKFFIGTNNLELRSILRKIFLVPIIYIDECGTLKMEHLSTKNKNKKVVVEKRKMKVPKWEKDLRILYQKKEEENEEHNSNSKKKRVKNKALNNIKKTKKNINKKKRKRYRQKHMCGISS